MTERQILSVLNLLQQAIETPGLEDDEVLNLLLRVKLKVAQRWDAKAAVIGDVEEKWGK